MAHTSTVTLRIPTGLKDDLDALATATDRSPSWLSARALKAWVDDNRWQLEKIREGIEQADAGALVDHDEVAGWLDSWGLAAEGEPPK